MKKVKITAIRQANYIDLQEKYENKLTDPCSVKVGDCWISENGNMPENFCESAWESMEKFVKDLANGKGNFFDGWMKKGKSAMISCNDGFRPVSFLIEVIE